MNTQTLLIEFLTEELPPINLFKNIGEAFTNSMCEELKNFIILPHGDNTILPQPIVSPRRFGCLIPNVIFTEPNSELLRKGPAINSGLVDNKPTRALEGFMRSCNITDINQLTQNDGYFYAQQQIIGKTLEDILDNAINNSLKKLLIAKNMHWGDNDFSFVRPVHNLLVRYGNKTIDFKTRIFGLKAVDYTLGHRILSNGNIYIDSAENYFSILEQQGKIIACYTKRREYIYDQLKQTAQKLNLNLNDSPGLLDEVTSLTEQPVILQGQFDTNFLMVPQECLILSMAKNQKYFALLDKEQKLSNKFLFVANIDSTAPEVVINGNERVLSARLADAKFFFDVDKKHPLDFYVNKLATVVYHNKLGTQLQRIERLKYIAGKFAEILGLNIQQAQHSANIIKADLSTEMVGEFPELQGVMGKYYALHHKETVEVANAIEKHYYPRFGGDEIPDDNLSVILSLADKLETLVGIWGIGLIPTGDKDPFALRRMAIGVARILLNNKLYIKDLINIVFASFKECSDIDFSKSDIKDEVYQFILQRLSNHLTDSYEFSYSTTCVQSVCCINPECFTYIPSLLNTLEHFAGNANNQLIISANKRIENILKKNPEYVLLPDYINIQHVNVKDNSGVFIGGSDTFKLIDESLLTADAEKKLYNKIKDHKNLLSSETNDDWNNYFKILEEFNPLVAAFFDNVMVIDQDDSIRINRLRLLAALYEIMNKFCILSELSI